MFQTLYPSFWCCSPDLKLVSGDRILGVIYTSLTYDPITFSIYPKVTNYGIDLQVCKLGDIPRYDPIIQGLLMNFSSKADVEILLSDIVHQHKLTLYSHKEIESSLFDSLKCNYVQIY